MSRKQAQDGSKVADYKPEDLLTAHEVAPLLRVALKTVYRYISNGDLPSVKFAGAVRVQYGALMDFIGGKTREQNANPTKVGITELQHTDAETLAYKVQEAAAMLHVEPANVMEAVGNGQLYAITIGTATVIPKGELEQLVEAPARIDQFTKQLLIQKGMVSEGFPFDNPELYKKREGEIKVIAEYVRTRVPQLKADYSFGLRLGLDEILQHVGNEVMEGKYAQQQTNHRRGRR